MSSNILEIYCDRTSGILKTFDLIPKQNLKLVAYRTSFSSATNAKNAKIIKFNASFLGANNFSRLCDDSTDTYQNVNVSGIPLPTSSSATSYLIACNIDVPMDKDIDGDVSYSLTFAGTSTGFEDLTLIFNYSNGMI